MQMPRFEEHDTVHFDVFTELMGQFHKKVCKYLENSGEAIDKSRTKSASKSFEFINKSNNFVDVFSSFG